MKERILTPDAKAERDEFEATSPGCYCHTGCAPCGHCTHPGNPLNQEDDSCWQEVGPELVKVSTDELIGKALDHAVAIAEGMYIHTPPGLKFEYWYKDGRCVCSRAGWGPSTSYSDGAQLIEKHMLRVAPHTMSNGVVKSWAADMTWPCNTMPGRTGPTMLVAACRAIVMKELGASVMVPKELVP